jgi:hypothetical protein
MARRPYGQGRHPKIGGVVRGPEDEAAHPVGGARDLVDPDAPGGALDLRLDAEAPW